MEMIKLRKEEMTIKAERERADIERSTRMEAELKLEEKRQSAQEHLFQMQTDTAAAMQAMLQTVIPKKSPLEKFREQISLLSSQQGKFQVRWQIS